MNVIITQNYICWLSVLVRNRDGNNTSTIVGEAYFHAICILKGDQLSLLAENS